MDYQFSLLQATFNASLDGILIVDHETRKVRDYNQRFLDLWGIPSELAAERNDERLLEFVLKQLKNPDQFLSLVRELYSDPEKKSFDTLEFKDGRFFDRHSEALIMDGKICGRVWFFRDVSDRTLLDRALKEQQERVVKSQAFLQTILGSMPSLISYVDRDFKYRYLNSTYEKWWGIRAEDYLGNPVDKLIDKESYSKVKPLLDEALQGRSLNYETNIPYPVVGLKSVQVNYIPHISEDGKVEGVFVIVHDITHLKDIQKELTEKERFLNLIVENIPSALYLKDVKNEFRITLWNRSAERIFGVSRNRILGKKVDEILPADQANRYQSDDQRVLEQNTLVELEEESRQTADGRQIFLHSVKLPIKTAADSQAELILCVCDDITSQREARKALLQSAKMSSLGEMASGIAHEINNPLTIIHGSATLMRERIERGKIDPPELQMYLEKIERTTQRIAKIVKGLRAFSRNSEADPMQLTKISQIVDDTLELCKERFRIHGVQLNVDVDSTISLECRGPQISQVIMNLLSNSYDAVAGLPDKWIELTAKADDHFLRVTVTDSGKGISPLIRDKIMQPFFTTKEVGSGTGLGLSISKGIAEEHRGELCLDLESPHTKFILKLPLRQISNH